MFRRVTGFLTMLCAFLLISAGLLPWAPDKLYAADFRVYADSTGIQIISGEPLFSMENMAPGDSAGTDLIVENNSSESFNLAISADVEEGDGLLYERLNIAIGGGDVFFGPLSSLREIRLGSFAAGSTSSFPMEITLSPDAGNECQGLAVTVKFQIAQMPDDLPPVPGGADPPDEPSPGDDPDDGETPQPGDPGDETDSGLPVTGTNLDLLLPLSLVLFLIGLLLLSSARKEQKE